MILSLLYTAFCVTYLPFFAWNQDHEARAYPLIFASGLYAILALLLRVPLPQDTLLWTAVAFGFYCIASLCWTDTKSSVHELFQWLSYIILFLASRSAPLPDTLLLLFASGSTFAALQLYRMSFRKPFPMVVFGNSNHNASFLLLSGFVGAWLSWEISPLFLPVTGLVWIALFLCRCRFSYISLGAGVLISALSFSGAWWVVAPLAFVGMGMFLLLRWEVTEDGKGPLSINSICVRAIYSASALLMIRRSLIYGHGINMFKKLFPNFHPLLRGKPWADKAFTVGGNESRKTHRAHNDHFEIVVELGLFGYGLLVFLFAQGHYTPILLGGLVAVSVCALFFFPLREVHTAAPIWAFAGATAPGTGIPLVLPSPIQWVLIAFFLIMIFQTLGKYHGLVLYDLYRRSKEETKQRELISKSLEADPYNNLYLALSMVATFPVNRERALSYISRLIAHYDGSQVACDCWDSLARSLLSMRPMEAAEMCVNKALYFNPVFQQSIELKKQIGQQRAVYESMVEAQNASNGKILQPFAMERR